MAELNRAPTPSEAAVTVVESEEENKQEVHTVRLRLRKPKPKKKVQWRAGTIDNEHMNKKKSKCCCQYRKPVPFNETSSSDEGECENCQGHVELKKKRKKNNDSEAPPDNATPPDLKEEDFDIPELQENNVPIVADVVPEANCISERGQQRRNDTASIVHLT